MERVGVMLSAAPDAVSTWEVFGVVAYTCSSPNTFHGQSVHVRTVPGSLSSIVMNAVLGETISTAPGWLVEAIATLKYSDNSVVLSSMVDTIRVADV